MNLPEKGDYIDIHDHYQVPATGKFTVRNLMAHEEDEPDMTFRTTYSIGIHPWHLSAHDFAGQLEKIKRFSQHPNIIALGEGGFDRLKGPDARLQQEAFSEQILISEKVHKPIFIHCVRAWDAVFEASRTHKPKMPWIIHGFRGKKELAAQLISRNMYISFWFDFIIRPEATNLVRSLPADRIFLETDGSGYDISSIYKKVAADLEESVDELKEQILSNFTRVFTEKKF